jgi:hypothetical protein
MSSNSQRNSAPSGNGKIHRTPTPQGLRKIKVIRFEAFLLLKALFDNCKCFNSKERLHRLKAVKVRKNEPGIVAQNYVNEYEPSNAINVRDSSPWQWRRVNEWDHYMNDPVEKLSGHMVT